MNSPAHDIALYISSQSIGTFGGDVFVSYEPGTPDETITVYDYPGAEPDTDQFDSRPNFQVRVRSLDYSIGYARQEAIAEALTSSVTGIECDTSRFELIVPITDIAGLGRDGNQRYLLVASYRARRTKKEI